MFKHLKNYDKVLVTGPHRSGTTITMRMIAHDTGFTGLDEKVFGFRFIRELPRVWQASTVLQAPNALPWLPVLVRPEDMVAVVMVRRSIADITASVARQKAPDGRHVQAPVFTAEQGYRLWSSMYKGGFSYLEVNYEDLSDHPLWVPKERRVGWHHKTWRNE